MVVSLEWRHLNESVFQADTARIIQAFKLKIVDEIAAISVIMWSCETPRLGSKNALNAMCLFK